MKWKREIAGMMLLVLLAAFCGGCTAGVEKENATQYALYFVQEDAAAGNTYDDSVKIELATEDCVAAARKMVDALLSEQDKAGVQSPFPGGVQLLDCTLNGTTLTLNFSEEYGQLSGIALIEADYCLVLTLCQLEGVDGVELLLEGDTMPGGPTGVLTADQAVQEGAVADPVSYPVQLFYPSAAGDSLEAEYVVLTAYGTTPEAKCLAILKALPLHPGGGGETYPEEGFSSHYITVEDGICELWLPDSWRDYLLERSDIWCDSLAESLCQVDGVDAVCLHTAENCSLDGWLFVPETEEADAS